MKTCMQEDCTTCNIEQWKKKDKKTTLLQNYKGKERQEVYTLHLKQSFVSKTAVQRMHLCHVFILYTGPFLLEMNFCRIPLLVFISFLWLKLRNWSMNKEELFSTPKSPIQPKSKCRWRTRAVQFPLVNKGNLLFPVQCSKSSSVLFTRSRHCIHCPLTPEYEFMWIAVYVVRYKIYIYNYIYIYLKYAQNDVSESDHDTQLGMYW